MAERIRALTLWPEWAWAIVNLGKRVENRDWPIPGGEWFALHAGKNIGGRPGVMARHEGLSGVIEMAEEAGWDVIVPDADDVAAARFEHEDRGAVDLADTPIATSAIVGIFRVTAHHRPGTTGPWKVPDAIGNVFEFRRLREPVSCKGAQGLWPVPDAVADELRRVGTVMA